MKIRSLLTIVAMISVFLLSVGTAHAVLGVADDVPANAIVTPIICTVPGQSGVASDLNTLFAIAETTCPDAFTDPQVPADGGVGLADVEGHFSVRNIVSHEVLTFPHTWSCNDVESFSCKAIVAGMSPSQKTQMITTVNGINYYAGYVVMTEVANGGGIPALNDFISWVYLEDLGLGFASGFNAIGLENGAGTRLEEDGGAAPITVETFYPRYLVLNDQPQTYNWWIILAGRNQISCASATFARSLTGVICDEEEDCPDFGIPIPVELNIIDVESNLPASLFNPLFPAAPNAGFAILTVSEVGDVVGTGAHVTITGTQDFSICGLTSGNFYSMFGWSYEREQSGNQNPGLSWDVVHPMHREYCNAPEGIAYITGSTCSITAVGP